jgi:2-hydroxyglutarate dehydrogenase
VGIAGLHSPATGIVDFRRVALAYADDVRAAGGEIRTGVEVTSLASVPARHAVLCAGAWSDRLAVLDGASPDPRIVPFRGAYLRLRAERRHLVRGLIYPVPDPDLPFLGVHLTRHVDGDILLGPTALLAGARDGYGRFKVEPRDVASSLGWPGTWRMARTWWRTGVEEIHWAASRRAFCRAIARFVPAIEPRDIEFAFAGVRAQAVQRDGKLVDDFVLSQGERALHVRNAPSPAATSSLALAREIADRADAAFSF